MATAASLWLRKTRACFSLMLGPGKAGPECAHTAVYSKSLAGHLPLSPTDPTWPRTTPDRVSAPVLVVPRCRAHREMDSDPLSLRVRFLLDRPGCLQRELRGLAAVADERGWGPCARV